MQVRKFEVTFSCIHKVLFLLSTCTTQAESNTSRGKELLHGISSGYKINQGMGLKIEESVLWFSNCSDLLFVY
jgi:hypothetical protein